MTTDRDTLPGMPVTETEPAVGMLPDDVQSGTECLGEYMSGSRDDGTRAVWEHCKKFKQGDDGWLVWEWGWKVPGGPPLAVAPLPYPRHRREWAKREAELSARRALAALEE